jgi:hypothetical protein
MATNNADEPSPADDARGEGTERGEKKELGPTLEDAIARARKLASQYGMGPVVLREAPSGFERELAPPPPRPRTQKPRQARRASPVREVSAARGSRTARRSGSAGDSARGKG